MAIAALPIRWLQALRRTAGEGSALQRARTFMILATLLYRASHLTDGVLRLSRLDHARPAMYAGLAVAAWLSVLAYGSALRRGRFDRRHVWADVLVTGCVLPLCIWSWGGARDPASLGWATLLGNSACAAAAVTLDRLRVVAAVAPIMALHLVGYRLVDAGPAIYVGHLNSLASSAAVAWIMWWYLRRQGSLLDAANARALDAEHRKARYAERLEHHRALHDTVLATLTALATGRAGPDSSTVRDRCAREAAYLRRLIQQTADETPSPEIGAALEEAVTSAESLGLKVTTRYHCLPKLPPEAAAALAGAVQEALNNVLKHAGTGHAFLTVTGGMQGHDSILITVVDRGPGFDAAWSSQGFGLRASVRDRMTAVGGRATVDAAPGEGVRVELRWPQ